MMNADQKGISVILLNWNGRALLEECLPRVMSNLKQWSVPYELIIVDNGSQDTSREYLKSSGFRYRLLALPKNIGFSKANNAAARVAYYDRLLFLNNDLYLEKSFIEPLNEAMEDKNVFAAAPCILRWDKKTVDDGLRYGKFESGLFSVELETHEEKIKQAHWVTFFCGACFLCRKDLFLDWGGFDPLYTPYAWEDLDLSYRAWKRGYQVAYVPESIAYHKREATTRSAFSRFFFDSLIWRNKFIFMWKNLHSFPMTLNHLFWLPWKLIKFLFNGRWRYVVGFFRALPHLPRILRERFREKKESQRSDAGVLKESYRLRSKRMGTAKSVSSKNSVPAKEYVQTT